MSGYETPAAPMGAPPVSTKLDEEARVDVEKPDTEAAR